MKKSLTILFVLIMIAGIIGTVFALHPYELNSDSPTEGGEPIVLTLTNDGDNPITVSGPVDVEVKVRLGDGSLKEWDRETLDPNGDDVLFEGEDSVVIEPGATAIVAELATGLPDTWRSYETADHELLISAWFKVDDVDWHSDEITHVITPADLVYELEMRSNSPTLPYIGEGQIPPEPIVLNITNTSGSEITISGPVVVQGTWERESDEGRRRMQFELIGGQESITIPAGETRDVVEIEAGAPWSWRGFYNPGVLPVTAWFQVDGASGPSLWESGRLCHVIEGVSEWEGIDLFASYLNVPPPVDNEDGTATITATLFWAETISSTYANEEVGQCLDCPGEGECDYVIQDINWSTTPAVGFTKEDLGFHANRVVEGMMVQTGEIISVKEIEPGVYEIVWQYDEGTHTIAINPKDSEPITYEEGEPGFFFDVTISIQGKELLWSEGEDGRYESQLSWPSVTLDFDSGTETEAEVSVNRKSTSVNAPPEGAESVGIYLDIELDGTLSEDTIITIKVSYNRDDLPLNTKEDDLKIFRFNEETGEWDLLPDQGVDKEGQFIWAKVQGGFSQFAVFELSSEVPGIEDDEIEEDETDGVVEEDDDEEKEGLLPATDNFLNWVAFTALLLIMAGIVVAARHRTKLEA